MTDTVRYIAGHLDLLTDEAAVEQYGPRPHSGELFIMPSPSIVPYLHSRTDTRLLRFRLRSSWPSALHLPRQILALGWLKFGREWPDASYRFGVALVLWVWNGRPGLSPSRQPNIHSASRALTIPGGAAVRSTPSRSARPPASGTEAECFSNPWYKPSDSGRPLPNGSQSGTFGALPVGPRPNSGN